MAHDPTPQACNSAGLLSPCQRIRIGKELDLSRKAARNDDTKDPLCKYPCGGGFVRALHVPPKSPDADYIMWFEIGDASFRCVKQVIDPCPTPVFCDPKLKDSILLFTRSGVHPVLLPKLQVGQRILAASNAFPGWFLVGRRDGIELVFERNSEDKHVFSLFTGTVTEARMSETGSGILIVAVAEQNGLKKVHVTYATPASGECFDSHWLDDVEAGQDERLNIDVDGAVIITSVVTNRSCTTISMFSCPEPRVGATWLKVTAMGFIGVLTAGYDPDRKCQINWPGALIVCKRPSILQGVCDPVPHAVSYDESLGLLTFEQWSTIHTTASTFVKQAVNPVTNTNSFEDVYEAVLDAGQSLISTCNDVADDTLLVGEALMDVATTNPKTTVEDLLASLPLSHHSRQSVTSARMLGNETLHFYMKAAKTSTTEWQSRQAKLERDCAFQVQIAQEVRDKFKDMYNSVKVENKKMAVEIEAGKAQFELMMDENRSLKKRVEQRPAPPKQTDSDALHKQLIFVQAQSSDLQRQLSKATEALKRATTEKRDLQIKFDALEDKFQDQISSAKAESKKNEKVRKELATRQAALKAREAALQRRTAEHAKATDEIVALKNQQAVYTAQLEAFTKQAEVKANALQKSIEKHNAAKKKYEAALRAGKCPPKAALKPNTVDAHVQTLPDSVPHHPMPNLVAHNPVQQPMHPAYQAMQQFPAQNPWQQVMHFVHDMYNQMQAMHTQQAQYAPCYPGMPTGPNFVGAPVALDQTAMHFFKENPTMSQVVLDGQTFYNKPARALRN